MRSKSVRPGIRISLVVALVLTGFTTLVPAAASACSVAPCQLTSTMMRIEDMHAAHTSKGTVCLQPTVAATEKYVLLTFPTQFTLSTTLGNWSTDVINHPNDPADLYWPSGAHVWPTTVTATNVNTGTNTVTFQFGTPTALNVAFNYCFNWNNAAAITTVGAAGIDLQGSVTTEDATPAIVDEGNIALTVLADNTIVVNAVVPPIFEFTMTVNTDVFGSNLSPTSVKTTSGVTPTIKTNAKGGWVMWAKDSGQALTSASLFLSRDHRGEREP